MTHERKQTRWSLVDWLLLIVPLLLLAVLAASFIWADPTPAGRSQGSSGPRSTEPSPLKGSGSVPVQPDAAGFEYRVMQEKYTTPQPNDQPEVQQRRRESWRAADGWTWARQTGSDPARFVLAPSKDWRAVRAARPTASDLARVLSRAVSVPAAQLPQAEFQFINDLLGSETLPAGALPKNYRQAMFEALAMNKGVVAEQHVRDPVGRAATRIALRSASSTLALYVDSDLNYLAYVGTADDGEQAYRVVTGRRHVKEIPADLLGQLGGERKEQAVWE